MSYNIGPKIGIDGEREFRSDIKKINDTYKALEAETKAVTAAFDAQGDEQGKLRAVSQQLLKQIDQQQKKMALLEDAVAKASSKFGENSLEATRLRGALFDTQATLTRLEAEFEDTSTRLKQTGESMEDFEEATVDAGYAAIDFGDILKANLISDLILDGLREMTGLVKDFAVGSIESAAEVQAATAQFEQTFKGIETAAGDALEGISDDTNIASTRMQGSFTKIYAFAKTAGAGSSEALNIASRAMLAAADNAAYYDKSIADATEQLQSFLKGNYENDAALGIAATETTRNTKANELYAKSFKELSEAQKVDVLLAMVEAGNAASGAIGQAARESDNWENVTGELAEVMRLLQAEAGKPALKKLVPIIKDITAAGYELIDDIDWDGFGDTVERIADGVIDYGPGIVRVIASVAAGIAAFKVTQKVGQFVSLAQSFISIGTAAQTAGAAVAASGAIAAATPWGLVATVIGGAVTAVTLIAANASAAESDLEKATKKLVETMEEADSAFESTKSDIEGTSYAAAYYVSRLRELEDAGLDTAVAHKEYEQVVEQLNELIPDLNLEIDEQTGLLKIDTAAVEANVEAWKRNATAKALQDKYSDILKAQGEASAELYDAEARLIALREIRGAQEATLAEMSARLQKLSDALAENQQKLASAETLTAEEAEKLSQEWDTLDEQYMTTIDELATLSGELQDTKDAEKDLTKEIAEAREVVNSFEDSLAGVQGALDLFSQQSAEATDQTERLTDAQLQVQKALDNLEMEYAEAQTAARKSIDAQIGMFEELSMQSDWSAEKILKNWESQRLAFDNYAANLQKAVDMGLDKALVQQLSDGSVESMQILDALVKDIDGNVDEINAAFARTEESRNHVSKSLAGVQTEYESRLASIISSSVSAGKDIAAGLTQGVTQNENSFISAMGAMGMKGLNTFRYTYAMKSPSRVMIAEGKNIDAGAAIGVERNMALFERSMVSMAEAGYDAFLAQRLERASAYPEMVNTSSTVNTKSTSHNYGGISIVINQQPGESAEDLAYQIMDIMRNEVSSKEASING